MRIKSTFRVTVVYASDDMVSNGSMTTIFQAYIFKFILELVK